MSCAFGCGKWLLFIFNFIFALCGLAFLIVGVLTHLKVKNVSDVIDTNTTFPSVGLIVVGSVIFVVAFFGCCGAIRESHCMIVTFAMFLLTILIIQIAVGIVAFVNLKGLSQENVNKSYTNTFDKYYKSNADREVIDWVQSNVECCGLNGFNDYQSRFGNSTLPWSCCEQPNADSKKSCNASPYRDGCLEKLTELIKSVGVIVGGIAIGVAVIELIGIIFALCLANSIRNAERRGYRV